MNSDLNSRIKTLERRLGLATLAVLFSLLTNAALIVLGAASAGGGNSEHLVARTLTIVDEKGNGRVMLGSPVGHTVEGPRISPGHGMVIMDENGYERFGLTLMENGTLGMGFDAAPGVGDDRNRERINFVVTPEGRAAVIFKDGTTRVRSSLGMYNEEGDYALTFLDWSQNPAAYVNFTLDELLYLRKLKESSGE